MISAILDFYIIVQYFYLKFDNILYTYKNNVEINIAKYYISKTYGRIYYLEFN